MNLYNTFTKNIEKVKTGSRVGIYVCGITPYDTTHLGHAFTFIVYDALVRYLKATGSDVTYVQNVTDIDDDILIRSKSIKKNWKALANSETKKHLQNMDTLGALRPDFYPRATENIGKMQEIIKKLLSQKLAYTSGGSVYFDVKKDNNFGKLSRFGYPAMLEIANERGNYPLDKHKKDPLDFVLWQKKHDGEPTWKSPWGDGRPGWHIECSAMSLKYLGPTITIHGGGSDLIFPHHEAEIAQSENFTGKKFVQTWMHVGMVYFEGKKMSKSLGNMIFVHDLIKKFDKNTIRISLLMHHYQEPWEFESGQMNIYQKISETFKAALKSKSPLTNHSREFFKLLDDDFRTDEALKLLVKLCKNNKISGMDLKTCLDAIGIIY